MSEERPREQGWWILTGLAIAALVHILLTPFMASAFGPSSVLFVILIIIMLALHMRRNITSLSAKELAYSTTGFLICWFILSPCWFYPALGRHSPQPHGELVANIAGSLALLVPIWLIVAGVLLRRRWWILLPFGGVQLFMAFFSILITAGMVAGQWI